MKSSLLFKAEYKDESLPPPYKNEYSIEANPASDGLLVNYQLKYLEREGLEEEDIYSEGFTLDDDYSWNGKLGLDWKVFLEQFLMDSTFKSGVSKNAPLRIQIGDSGPFQAPENIDDWQYALQELTQAIFEVSGREAPLEITLLNITKDITTETSYLISFADRTISTVVQTAGKINKQKKDWKESKKLMQLVYSLDYIGEKALLTQPVKPGKYINIGEGAWYELRKAVVNPGKKNDLLGQLEKLFTFSD